MIRRNGPQRWKNVHVTYEADLQDLLDVDNSSATDPQLGGWDILTQTARDLDAALREAKKRGLRIRALGSGWAMTDIAVTDGWLINTKLLNGCFDPTDRYFESSYALDKRPLLVIAQCGMSVAELNTHLEVRASNGIKRALKTAGIGAGQTIAGAVSGNTHGAAVNFGAMPDFVVGLQIVTGSGRSLWIEPASQPVLNDAFVAKLDVDRIRDDDVFNAALVNLGAFGIITAMAIETDPIYHLDFPPVAEIAHDAIKEKLNRFDSHDPPDLYHYEFIFDPYSREQIAIETKGIRKPYGRERPAPDPTWIVRSKTGYALGDQAPPILAGFPLLSAKAKTALQFREYRKRNIVGNVRATPGQVFTATITYFEGFTETAFAVPITGAARAMDTFSETIRDMDLPSIVQVRLVHPSRALLGFTYHEPKAVVFELGVVRNAKYPVFEEKLREALTAAGVPYTHHWSKNAELKPETVVAMYGQDRVDRWKAARRRVFGGDAALQEMFNNDHLLRCGLA